MNPGFTYPYHEDLEWLAIDRDGLVARFTTGGRGPIPQGVFQCVENQRLLQNVIAGQAPKSGSEVLCRVVDPEDFRSCAGHGLFVYDWSDVHRATAAEIHAYELMARPIAPLNLAWILERLNQAEQLVPRFNLSFRESSLVPITAEIDWLLP